MTKPATPAPTSADPILQVKDLEVAFPGRRGKQTRVINGVSFDLAAGETLSLVGESGSGKTTIGRAILGLAPVTGGAITFRGTRSATSPASAGASSRPTSRSSSRIRTRR